MRAVAAVYFVIEIRAENRARIPAAGAKLRETVIRALKGYGYRQALDRSLGRLVVEYDGGYGW